MPKEGMGKTKSKNLPRTNFSKAINRAVFQNPFGRLPIESRLNAAPSSSIPSMGTHGPANVAISMMKSSGGLLSGALGILDFGTVGRCTKSAFRYCTFAIMRENTSDNDGRVRNGFRAVQIRRGMGIGVSGEAEEGPEVVGAWELGVSGFVVAAVVVVWMSGCLVDDSNGGLPNPSTVAAIAGGMTGVVGVSGGEIPPEEEIDF